MVSSETRESGTSEIEKLFENQFVSKCKSTAIHTMRDMEEEPTYLYQDTLINTRHVNTVKHDALFAEMKVEDNKIIFQIDFDATVSVLPKSLSPAVQFQRTLAKLRVWNNAIVHPLDAAEFFIRNIKMKEYFSLKFILVDKDVISLLGRRAAKQLGLIQVNHDRFAKFCLSKIFAKYNFVFDKGV